MTGRWSETSITYQLKYRLPFWKEAGMNELAGHLMNEERESMEAYN
jgi:hypothetical protein